METRKPTVSNLISLLDKPALLKWANKIGLEGIHIDDYRKKSLAGGSFNHTQIERYVKDKTPFDNPEHQKCFDKYFCDKTILCCEQEIETEYFIGRYDIKIEYNGKKYICDFKSNQSGIYLENKLQLVAYRMGEPCDGVGVISVPSFTYIPVHIPNFEPYEEILKALSKIYTLKKQL